MFKFYVFSIVLPCVGRIQNPNIYFLPIAYRTIVKKMSIFGRNSQQSGKLKA